jgi:hypothetical protein
MSAAANRPLVTNDNHLLADRNIIGIDALTPRAFLAREAETPEPGPEVFLQRVQEIVAGNALGQT